MTSAGFCNICIKNHEILKPEDPILTVLKQILEELKK